MKAPKLQAGDGIRIISPSNSLGIIAPEQIEAYARVLESYWKQSSVSRRSCCIFRLWLT
ncbi:MULTISPECIES: hypothetical protein [unclassified Paenibacillus]|uniref:hypothetical protein n=1 Tax=unclassified Paenibacillus TaxID=185978 RepID=UPI00240719BF|nr:MULTISPECIES: hypothetical protein [unclassified Paenibacillus]MDF9841096.1 muramoyltetrapeptide carboxypeptidase LdcA involved in peptidoglycan recycling [Paenibacillus sp. PastF-2]MDF9847732.1 muramoyltetrapeptide carboxypeptidase LdcA involved in peptidoglycan recycling [Paenibacillus sp. PastM-2]MDF9854301.1 muramoyltetrapeptide carboxypeptidase LdcA involved in peptidoglycan recycling [Paenibacillus sp. PastF-1]MDH6479528.1 muramoyltetrapeptide carboxypeptidase LdcA involved in peptidog